MKLTKFPEVDPSPVLSSGIDGVPKFLNSATYHLLETLQLDNVDDILPSNHKGLAKACLTTNTPLTDERNVMGRTIVWTYHPDDDIDLIYIFGHDITDYRLKNSCLEGLPNLNPDPVLTIDSEGNPEFINPATEQLLKDLQLENINDILPSNHTGMITACLETGQTLIDERHVAGHIIAWTYHPLDYSDLIYLYGHDLSKYNQQNAN